MPVAKFSGRFPRPVRYESSTKVTKKSEDNNDNLTNDGVENVKAEQ